jgi:hypothetical protein
MGRYGGLATHRSVQQRQRFVTHPRSSSSSRSGGPAASALSYQNCRRSRFPWERWHPCRPSGEIGGTPALFALPSGKRRPAGMPALPGKRLPHNSGVTKIGSGARHLAPWTATSLRARREGKHLEGVRPRPGLPPEPTGPLPGGRERTASLETGSLQFPFMKRGRTAASLDSEAGRPSQFSKRPSGEDSRLPGSVPEDLQALPAIGRAFPESGNVARRPASRSRSPGKTS